MAKKGIDVSKHQGNIDWAKVKKAGIEFAILRVGYGMYDDQKDSQFENNYAGCLKNNIPVGVYLYSYALNTDDAKKEAETTLKWLNGRELNLPVYLDMEDKTQQNLGKTTLTNICIAFCEEIEKAGYWAGVYANKYWFSNLLDNKTLSDRFTCWVAQYNSVNTYTGKYDMWQYSSSGRVDGISGNVDMNYLYSDVKGGKGTATAQTKNSNVTGDITYQSYDNAKGEWLPEVKNYSGFAGNLGNALGGLRAKPKYGEIKIQAHELGGKWLSWISSNNYSAGNTTNGNSYSGLYGKSIDAIRIKSTKGYVTYQAHTVGGGWLDEVDSRNADSGKTNSYAGVIGKPIDAIRMK